MNQPPWTDIGRLQQEMQGKVDSHEVSALNSKVANLQCAVREIRAEVIGIQYQLKELQQAQEHIREILIILEEK